MFAGEVLIVVVGYVDLHIFASAAILPFMVFELFIGSIQAYVFFMLTTVFISLGMADHGEHSADDILRLIYKRCARVIEYNRVN